MKKRLVYMDHAAATPIAPEVLTVMQPYFADQFYNPSSTYLAAQAVAQDIQAARTRVAHWLGARPAETVFTAGGTEANNLAINGVMQAFPGSNVVISAIEHESVLRPAGVYRHKLAPVTPSGLIDLDRLEKLIDDKTVLVSIIYANNEIGTIQPLRRIAQLLKSKVESRRLKVAGSRLTTSTYPLYFHSDACQATPYLNLNVNRLGLDLMSLNGGKIYGPKQSGALFIRTGVNLRPQILGGGQEHDRRSGTENVAQIMGLSKALDIAQLRQPKEASRLQDLQRLFFQLLEDKIPQFVINGERRQRLPGNVHITIPGQDNERLMMALDERGIQCATGSACSASNEEPSHVLKALGLSDEAAQSSLRFTMGHDTTEADIHYTIAQLKAVLQ